MPKSALLDANIATRRPFLDFIYTRRYTDGTTRYLQVGDEPISIPPVGSSAIVVRVRISPAVCVATNREAIYRGFKWNNQEDSQLFR